MQKTLKSKVSFDGLGLHSGVPTRMEVHPAAAGYGIWFKRTDVQDRDAFIPANWRLAQHSPLCTRLVNADGIEISTVEHIMAALAGCGIYNALIEVDGPEVPIMDGSAAEFVQAFLDVGIQTLTTVTHVIEVLNPVRVERKMPDGQLAVSVLEPSDCTQDFALKMDFSIEFGDAAIGKQSKSLSLANGCFVHELSDSRTFCRNSDVTAMWEKGLALGGTLENAVVVDGDQVLSPGGLRHADEPVRHKMLDAMGDLALAGAPIKGAYKGIRAGHTLTNMLLQELFSDPANYRIIECDPLMAATLPGAGLTGAGLNRVEIDAQFA